MMLKIYFINLIANIKVTKQRVTYNKLPKEVKENHKKESRRNEIKKRWDE